jgi:hypothetical protein
VRRIWAALPGPTPVKLVEALALIVAALIVLFFLFEWAGGLLDSGGAIAA